jgi:plasmid stabilization system protein ParE
MDYKYQLLWSDEAIENLESILKYLQENWTQREVNGFKLQLKKLLNLINSYPLLFPISEYNPRLRKAVLSKQTIIFYEFKGSEIYLAYLFNTRQDIQNL